MALFQGKETGSDKESMSKLELSHSSSEATALAEVWQARQRCNAGDGGGVTLLSVTHSRLTKHFVAKVFQGKAWPSLERLYLQYNLLSDDGVEMLAECVAEGWLPALHTLNLAGNEVGNTGAAALAETIHHKNSRLCNIYLYDNKIGDLGAEALAQCCIATLPGHPSRHLLRELFIWGNHLKAAGKEKLCRARHDGLLMWIDLTSDSHIKTNETKNGQKQARHTIGASCSRQSGKNMDDREAALPDWGHSSSRQIQCEVKPLTIVSGHFWTPRRAPRTLSQDLAAGTRSAADSSTTKNGVTTTTGRDETVLPKQSSIYTSGRAFSFWKESYRMPDLSEGKSGSSSKLSPPSPSANDEQSFKFGDLLMKAKAMESPICGPATTILPSPTLSGRRQTNNCSAGPAAVDLPLTCRGKKESPDTFVADSFKSPATMSTDRWMKKSTPRGQDGALKVGKSFQVSPTSPIGEYLETTLRMETQEHCPSSACAFDNGTFRTLLDKAQLLERRNNATPMNRGRSLSIQKKNNQVPFFVPDLEDSAADFTKLCNITPPPDQHGHVGGSQSREQRSRQPNEACPPSTPPRGDSSQCTSPTFHQLRNHFEAKSAAVGNC